MQSITIASIVFACVFGSTLLGMLLHGAVPDNHLSADSKDVVKLAMGLIATMAALVLGLLTASAKGSFDTESGEVEQMAANAILLDRVLAQYGPETKDIRDLLRQAIAVRLAQMWPEEGSHTATVDAAPQTTPTAEGIEGKIRALSPQTDAQRELKTRALSISGVLLQTRWLLFAQMRRPIPMPFLVVLIFWLSILFLSFGVFAPRNGTVITALVFCALAVAGSIFLILELNHPFEGLVKVSSAPVHYALAHLGQ
jgi:hypothetical protein